MHTYVHTCTYTQSIYEDVARDTNRGHTIESVKECFVLAKDAGFKVGQAGWRGAWLDAWWRACTCTGVVPQQSRSDRNAVRAGMCCWVVAEHLQCTSVSV